MLRRFGVFAIVNILMVVTISLVLNLLGVRPYLTAYGLDYQALAVFCLVWGMGGSFISLLLSKTMAKMMMGVEILDGRNSAYGGLVQRVHALARKAGLEKMPEVGVYQSPEMNAFATGPSKNNSLVAVSSGLIQQMSDDELDGVLGHEIAHIANGDMVSMALIQGVMNAFVMFLARVLGFFLSQAMRSNDNERPSYWAQHLMVMLLEVVLGIFAAIVVRWFSRQREFRADRGGAAVAGKEKMIRALEALDRKFNPRYADDRGEAIATLKISSSKRGNQIMELFSTHPSLQARIEALKTYRV